MAYACKICLLTKGLKGKDIASLPQTQEELDKHLEDEHHMPVQRPGESEEQTIARFVAAHPGVDKCEDCKERGAPWTA